MSTGSKGRVDGQPAFALHTFPFRETSLIVEAFTRDHGRIALVARGARRPRSVMRGLLMAFQPIELGWFGQGEMRTLAKVEWVGGQPLLQAQALLLGYYMNELLLKLLPREDAHPALFQAYAEAVHALAIGEPSQASLRRFEKTLLKELGYGLTLDREAESGWPVEPQKRYAYVVERGPVLLGGDAREAESFSGRALLAIAQDDFSDAETLAQCKQLMRTLIQHYLGGQRLSSRRVFMELQEL
ncbi:MAG: DNA repair protein RecO [Betaproteobacteria bacterium RBG_19FT_COMBO_58_11]|nr:MAG: DNA repair protein RecO [Betaproteobacteria bacterium RBG_19FT_COMBO_58_11]